MERVEGRMDGIGIGKWLCRDGYGLINSHWLGFINGFIDVE